MIVSSNIAVVDNIINGNGEGNGSGIDIFLVARSISVIDNIINNSICGITLEGGRRLRDVGRITQPFNSDSWPPFLSSTATY